MRKTATEAMILSLIIVASSAAAGTTETRSVEVVFDGSADDAAKWSVIQGVEASGDRLVMLTDCAVGSMEILAAQLPMADTDAGESGVCAEISAKGILFKADTHLAQSVTMRAKYGDKTVFGTVRVYRATRGADVAAETLLGYESGGAVVLVKKVVQEVVLAENETSLPSNDLILEMEEGSNTVKLRFVHGGALLHEQDSTEAVTPWSVSEHKIDACRLELMGNACKAATPSAGTFEVSLEVNVP